MQSLRGAEVDIIKELKDMMECRKKRVGIVMVKAMVEYFLACRDLNELEKTRWAQKRQGVPTRDTDEQIAELRGKAEYVEELVPELFDVYEDTPGLLES